MLGDWALGHGKWKKKLAWLLYQRTDLRNAAGFHATSDQEAEEIRKLGFTQPIAVVPNGITLPAHLPARSKREGKRVALFLSRIHPKKGLVELVRAWRMAEVGSDWELVIAGPDENGFRRVVEQEINAQGLNGAVSFAGPLDDVQKWQAYRSADLFVLPSFNENFGIVIAEAMAAELPVLTTTGTPWRCLQEHEMGWWVENNSEAISAALVEAIRQPPESLYSKGQQARRYVLENFSWESSADALLEFYESLG